jgi:HEPN domain-containing protein
MAPDFRPGDRFMTRRVFRAADGYDPVDLLKYGRGHLRAAEILFGTDFHCFDSAAHLSHLAIELQLKAILLKLCGAFYGEHSLRTLVDDVLQAGLPLALTSRDNELIYLLDLFQESRYPNPHDPPQVGNSDLELVQELWNRLLAQMPAQLRDDFTNANPLEKGGRVLMVKEDPDGDRLPAGGDEAHRPAT